MQSLLQNEYPSGLTPPKYQIGMKLNFGEHGSQICIGMIYCTLPAKDSKWYRHPDVCGQEGWYYYFGNGDYSETGVHEQYISLENPC
jgi:hypothetical protein